MTIEELGLSDGERAGERQRDDVRLRLTQNPGGPPFNGVAAVSMLSRLD